MVETNGRKVMVAEIVFNGITIAVVKEGEVLRSGDTLVIEDEVYSLGEREIKVENACSYDKKSRYKTITRIKFKAFKL